MKSMKAVIGSAIGVAGRRKVSTIRFVGVTQPDEGIKGERGISNPRCSIIPVPLSADEFWK